MSRFEIPSPVFHTDAGTPYLKAPGICLLAATNIVDFPHDFIDGFDESIGFKKQQQEDTNQFYSHPGTSTDSDLLCKFAGQLCYLAFGPGSTPDSESAKYFANILQSGHGSVLEHASFTFLLYGISRSLTHELVRHRAGFAFSQVSQRYVDGKKLRFVMRPEFTAIESPELDSRLQRMFIRRIDEAAREYDAIANTLKDSSVRATGLKTTADRKAVNQAARACLPNETEAPIVVTANVRAWRHFLNMRGSIHAEPEIRRVAVLLAGMLKPLAPSMFQDVRIREAPGAGEVVGVGFWKV